MSVFGSLDTWFFWAWYAAGLSVMTGTLAIHLHVGGQMPRRCQWLLVVGGALGVAGAIVGGMQAGPYPPMRADTGVTVIRALWVRGITLGIVASDLYWWSVKEKQS